MALTADVKDELARIEVSKTTVRAAELATILRFSGGLHLISGRIAVESELDTAQLARRVRKDLGELYDIGFDKPEGHVVAADGKLHYAFYAKSWKGPIELRGLGKGRYRLTDSFTGEPLGTASAADNRINASFDRFLVIEAAPTGEAA